MGARRGSRAERHAYAERLTQRELVCVAAEKWAELFQAFDCMIVANRSPRDRVESDAMNAQMEAATQRLLDAVAELES